MELATIGGIILVFVAVIVSLIMEGASPTSIILIPPIILVFLGSIGAAVAGGFLSDVSSILKQTVKAFTTSAPKSADAVTELIGLADIARREGLLALEEKARSAEDPFLREGLEMTVDGTDADEIYDVLAARIKTRKKADQLGIKFFADMGGYAPTIGIIGTVIGLIHVLSNLDAPEELGHLIAGAFVATLWGVMTANVMWLPLSSKLKRISEAEALHLEMVLEGIMSIQAGTSPRVVEKRLRAVIAGDAPLQDAA
ncbi:MotA/TolQ/ExbB proton channel family protein [Phycicoccus sp. MAQZ13P-2]|uniref:motility protein A n=1 Tax=Phycicoccus mangrovi TaxID=2840470 RepID=UPI001BFFE453|nr:MotA/TolQ/ExbB proton channel family protein [Phycicoccus mangrovi]MBT9254949.1 MotA/TolQ/ExbB proton channel family protein [Phycicoccus mangrovi]MBT9256054.1 MotA/TolQ/ExbB proton channel family protein [Phycicoccus mangrovi]MBT9273933.1 MotA/TolQ/ExbB proton channel family protein [Phycicoccus mangrovi]